MKSALLSTMACFIGASLVGAASVHAADSKPPNIVFILADDLEIMDVNAYAIQAGNNDLELLVTLTSERKPSIGKAAIKPLHQGPAKK